jgi:flagellar motor switch protein FliN
MSQMIEPFLQQQATAALRAQTIALQEAVAAPQGEALLRTPHPLHGIKVRLQVRVGESAMTVGELMQARQNEVLVLDRSVDAPVDLLLEGQVVARGELVAVDGIFAVRITELPLSLQL